MAAGRRRRDSAARLARPNTACRSKDRPSVHVPPRKKSSVMPNGLTSGALRPAAMVVNRIIGSSPEPSPKLMPPKKPCGRCDRRHGENSEAAVIGERCAGQYRSTAGEQRGPQGEGSLPQRFAVGRAADRKAADRSGHTKPQMVRCHARDDRAGKPEHCGNDLRNIGTCRGRPSENVGEPMLFGICHWPRSITPTSSIT